ncbi:transcription termination factor NusA [bacterium]|nr:transcription termination factor NusA [bacterium]MBU1025661.1 transcription termination factor NusA [bacterium]
MFNELMKLEIQETMRDKGIPIEVIREAVEAALTSAYKKDNGRDLNVAFRVDATSGEIKAFDVFKVVEEIEDPETQFTLEKAQEYDPDAKIGGEILIPKENVNLQFSRIATQSAKQVVMQRIKDAERDLVFQEYLDKKGQLISGKIRRMESGNVFVELDKVEGIIPASEQVFKDVYKPKSTIRAIILDVVRSNRGPQITLSRAHADFVRELFALEVPEIAEGLVEAVNIAREPGSRTKIAVYSNTPDIDPVGACVGSKGARVQAVVNELKGENIDIIHWTDDPFDYIANALSPAQVYSVEVFEEEQSAEVIVPDDQVSLAIGKAGQNVRLAAKLTGWHIDIKKQSDKMAEEEKEHVVAMEEELKIVLSTEIQDLPIRRSAQNALIETGYNILSEIIELTKDQILAIKGFGANSLEDLNRFLREYGIEIE